MKLNKGKDSSAAGRERVLLGWFHCSADRIIVTVTLIDSDRPLFLLFSAGKATERMASWHRCVREIIQIPLWGWIFIGSLIFHYSFLLLFLRYVHVPHLFYSKTPMISCFIHRISTILMMDFLCSLLFIHFAFSILNTNIFSFSLSSEDTLNITWFTGHCKAVGDVAFWIQIAFFNCFQTFYWPYNINYLRENWPWNTLIAIFLICRIF